MISPCCSRSLHVWPDYHGNRSPLADPSLTGAVVGLSLDTDTASLATLYLATLQVWLISLSGSILTFLHIIVLYAGDLLRHAAHRGHPGGGGAQGGLGYRVRGPRQVQAVLADAGGCTHYSTVCTISVHVQADVLGREVLVPQETESVLLGASMLAMSAAR